MNSDNAPLVILGVNGVYHESSAAIVIDGHTKFAIEEERLNRVKHAKPAGLDNPHVLPHNAISECLKFTELSMKDVDIIAFSFNPAKRLSKHRHVQESSEENGWGTAQAERAYFDKLMTVPRQFSELGFTGQFMWVDHEMAHAASAFYPSPYEQSAIISIDGIGEFESASIGYAQGNDIQFTHHINYPHSIGFLWEKMAKYLGFSEYDACKVMSVASFGDGQRYKKQMQTLLYPEGFGFKVDADTLCFRLEDYSHLTALFNVSRRHDHEPLLAVHHDIAAALQAVTSEVLLHLAKSAHELTGSNNLCMAGGVALNCVANTVLFEEGPFENLYIQPAANDAGTALGAALWAYHGVLQSNTRVPQPEHTYLGSSFDDVEIRAVLDNADVSYTQHDDLAEQVAQLLAQGKVIGWFQGAMEFGPRALGNRSLLADPRDPEMVKRLNRLVKHREDHRPFCPSVLTEYADQWFEIKKQAEAARYMLMAYPANEQLKDKIPAVVHIDGTSRIQRVDKVSNPNYHALISAFNRLTGVPMLLNTSFNDREPIVCTPQNAVNTLMRTNIDFLAIGSYLVLSNAKNTRTKNNAKAQALA
ncbi:carbamoyltransferase family protein [Pseudoalteromonas aurantia]|uniref:Carbamoyltransferase n=1 Tax=Pseudoalteromonas aurantia 208 TaxID=1314867 RepID=A0ABR9EH82_9GAMM|nr:carbamoyltransferase C-terminal domain-containing protein [Pseudoalteromonas aurantia]MBE0370345.1 carbamoyltransferase [Pseudoalteromonas aurantia 208]